MREKNVFPVLSVAGSDCSGGAGIQADIKTISACGCYAMAAITSITAQNTTAVDRVEGVSPSMVYDQIRMVFEDIPPLAVKTGMLFSGEIVRSVADALRDFKAVNLVVDPVMISTSGSRLISEEAVDLMVNKLFPLAELVTPNRHEAEALTGLTDPEAQGRRLIEMGCKAVLVKGGDSDNPCMKTDLLVINGSKSFSFSLPAIETPNTHGTGCTLSSAIASNLAKGHSLYNSVALAKAYVNNAIFYGADRNIGRGHGPLDHFYRTDFGCD